ncbi:MAG TPA: RNA polymerase sigma factor SigJ [Alphaproteobacteria bacterium]|nr:RNA polymerase sigma factor SigJ [Alphaproteobacteria bacterium]
MSKDANTFDRYRPKLHGIAYRMLGSRADAEDVVQDAYLRWHGTDTAELRSPEAWLVTVVTRLSLDRLRAAKVERQAYAGQWIPEPLVEAHAPPADQAVEIAGDLSIAFLMVLERLAPEERAAFLLHDVFDISYAEIATMIGKRQDACRQAVHRARRRVRRDRPRFQVDREDHRRLLERFVEASRSGDREALLSLLAEDVSFTSDGGGKVPSVSKVLHGAVPVARFYQGIARRIGGRAHFHLAQVNGSPGILRYLDGDLDSVTSLVTDGRRIVEIYTIRNPDKLARIEHDLPAPTAATPSR